MIIGPNDNDKTLHKMLQEVNTGQYENFRAFLQINKIYFINYFIDSQKNFFHFCNALKGSVLKSLKINPESKCDEGTFKKIATISKDTLVSTLDLSGLQFTKYGLEQLYAGLKGTGIKTLNLAYCGLNRDVELIKLGDALKNTAVTTLNLSNNNISPDAARDLIILLKNTTVTELNLTKNRIFSDSHYWDKDYSYKHSFPEGLFPLINRIPRTSLIKLESDYESEALQHALALNERKLKQTPYTAICLTYLPKEQKKLKPLKLHDNSSREETIEFTCGILASLGTEVPELQAQIISYLPFMNFKHAEKLQKLAKEHHGHGLEPEDWQIEKFERDNWCSIQ